MNDVSGGLAAVSVGLPAWLLLIVLGVAVLGAWKLSKLLWATFKVERGRARRPVARR